MENWQENGIGLETRMEWENIMENLMERLEKYLCDRVTGWQRNLSERREWVLTL